MLVVALGFVLQAGLRAVHDLGPEIRRAISGNLEDDAFPVTKETEEPIHRVNHLSKCINKQEGMAICPIRVLCTCFTLDSFIYLVIFIE